MDSCSFFGLQLPRQIDICLRTKLYKMDFDKSQWNNSGVLKGGTLCDRRFSEMRDLYLRSEATLAKITHNICTKRITKKGKTMDLSLKFKREISRKRRRNRHSLTPSTRRSKIGGNLNNPKVDSKVTCRKKKNSINRKKHNLKKFYKHKTKWRRHIRQRRNPQCLKIQAVHSEKEHMVRISLVARSSAIHLWNISDLVHDRRFRMDVDDLNIYRREQQGTFTQFVVETSIDLDSSFVNFTLPNYLNLEVIYRNREHETKGTCHVVRKLDELRPCQLQKRNMTDLFLLGKFLMEYPCTIFALTDVGYAVYTACILEAKRRSSLQVILTSFHRDKHANTMLDQQSIWLSQVILTSVSLHKELLMKNGMFSHGNIQRISQMPDNIDDHFPETLQEERWEPKIFDKISQIDMDTVTVMTEVLSKLRRYNKELNFLQRISQMPNKIDDQFPVTLPDERLELKIFDRISQIKTDTVTVVTDKVLSKSRSYDKELNLLRNLLTLNSNKPKLSLFDLSSSIDMTYDDYDTFEIKKGFKTSKELDDILFSNFTCPQMLTVAPLESLRRHFDDLAQGYGQSQEDRMSYEGFRLGTFNKVNISAPCIPLAAAGFYATGDGDETRCFSCRTTHRGWARLDNPSAIHRRISPGCHFISGHDSSNTPIHTKETPLSSFINETNEGKSLVRQNEPSSGSFSTNNLDTDNKPSTRVDAQGSAQAHEGCCSMDVHVENAMHPHYQDKTRRMESFKDWPLTNRKTPAELVAVGFFYAGYGDCVRCFCCGVGLRTWKEEDDPWREHINHNESCEYVRRVKGASFIADTLSSTSGSPQNSPVVENGSSCDGDDILSRPVCKQLLEMGFNRSKVVRHIKEVEKAEGPSRIQIETILEKLLNDGARERNAVPRTQTYSVESCTSISVPTILNSLNQGERRHESEALTQDERYMHRSLDEGYGTLEFEPSASYSNSAVGVDSMTVTKTSRTGSESSARQSIDMPSRAALTSLSEETRELRESGLCKICLDEPANIVFLPCGHLLACVTCTPALERCPLCRSSIRGSVKVHLADMSSVSRLH